jgi:hypothetical protein
MAVAPVLSLDVLDEELVATLLGLLWQARVQPFAADPACTARAEALVHHLVVRGSVEELDRHADVVRLLVAALDAEARGRLVESLGAPDTLHRRYVEHLLRPTTRVARAYACA